MGMPPSERNCLGGAPGDGLWSLEFLDCGPAMRVPRPAAGRIAKTCITCGVYKNGAARAEPGAFRGHAEVTFHGPPPAVGQLCCLCPPSNRRVEFHRGQGS